ncbi:MAG: hypothetical protein ACK559_26835, partial [bacterium]
IKLSSNIYQKCISFINFSSCHAFTKSVFHLSTFPAVFARSVFHLSKLNLPGAFFILTFLAVLFFKLP